MNLPLDFDSAERWTRIVKIAVILAAVYAIAVVGVSVKGNFLGGAVLLLFGLAFYAVLRRARRVSMGAADVSPPAASPCTGCACGGSPLMCRAVSCRSIDFQP